MALHDEILREIIARRIPWRFTTADLKRIPSDKVGRYRVGNGEFSVNTINTVPRNHSIRPDRTDPGDYVRKGRKPAFIWHGSGVYELAVDRQHEFESTGPDDEEFDQAEGSEEALFFNKRREYSRGPLPLKVDDELVLRITHTELDPARIIVRYIAEKPFQTYYRRRPAELTKPGWGERLESYYWPVPDQNWEKTCAIVTSLSLRVQEAIRMLVEHPNSKVAAFDLLNAFKETCLWGGVRLPETDATALAAEALRTFSALSSGNEPSGRLNSAWTKLYAFALPDNSVIYDSRVAAAVTSILSPAMPLCSLDSRWEPYKRLGTVPGRGGSRPRAGCWKWPVGYGVWASQIAANLLCRKVMEEVNRQATTRPNCRKRDSTSWTLREVEAVLFMEGY